VNDADSDVLILGGGVIGLSCALSLLRAGRAVTVLDGGAVGSGSSRGNCGTITPSHLPLHAPGTIGRALRWMFTRDAPFYVKPTLDPQLLAWLLRFARLCNAADFRRTALYKARLLLDSREQLTRLIARENIDCEFAETGTLYVWRGEEGMAQAQGDAVFLRELGVAVEILDGAAVRKREPALRAGMAGGHFHPGDASLRPDRYVAELARVVRSLGGIIHEHAPVRALDARGGRIGAVSSARGEFHAREVVMALGSWSAPMARQIGLRLPIQPGKGYSITYARPQCAPAIPLVLEERSVCVTTWASGYRLGSTMEFSGYDSTLNAARLAALRRGAAEYLAEPEGPVMEEQWYGWRPMTYDDLPVIGRAARFANLTLATGHGMLGMSLSAITAQLVTDLLARRVAGLDMAPLSPRRFGA
jgi:D-amino-acid dehydrogenase